MTNGGRCGGALEGVAGNRTQVDSALTPGGSRSRSPKSKGGYLGYVHLRPIRARSQKPPARIIPPEAERRTTRRRQTSRLTPPWTHGTPMDEPCDGRPHARADTPCSAADHSITPLTRSVWRLAITARHVRPNALAIVAVGSRPGLPLKNS